MTSQSLTFDAVAEALPGPMVFPLASLLVCPRDVVPRSGGGSGPTLVPPVGHILDVPKGERHVSK